MKITSGRVRWGALLKKVQVIKYNARLVTRGAFTTEEDLAHATNVNEAIKTIDALQSKLLSWSEAQNYMLMGRHFVRKEAGGEEIAELEEIATKRTEKIAGDLKKEANRLSQLVIDHLNKKEQWRTVDALRRSLGMKS